MERKNEYFIEELNLLTGVQSDDINFLVALLIKQSEVVTEQAPVILTDDNDCLCAPTLEEFLSGKEKL